MRCVFKGLFSFELFRQSFECMEAKGEGEDCIALQFKMLKDEVEGQVVLSLVLSLFPLDCNQVQITFNVQIDSHFISLKSLLVCYLVLPVY